MRAVFAVLLATVIVHIQIYVVHHVVLHIYACL